MTQKSPGPIDDTDVHAPAPERHARDALYAGICVGLLGLLWLVLELYWQGLALMAVGGAVAYLGYVRGPRYEKKASADAPAPVPRKSQKAKTADDKLARSGKKAKSKGKKRKRKK